MGKITGFLEIERHDRKYAPVAERVKHYREFVIPLSEKDTRDQAARCMNCGIPYCHGTGSVAAGHAGLPGQQPDSRFQRSGLSGQLGRSLAQSALDQQFPGIHRAHLPGAVRSLLHAQHRRQSRHHQDHRMRDRRPRLGKRLAQAGNIGAQDRQEGRGRRLRPGGTRLRAAARARRPRRACVREIRQGRRPAALRHSRFQDGEARHRPPRRADGSRGRHLPLRQPGRRHVAQARSTRARCSTNMTRWR